jgi:hypothetical protein
VPWKAFTRGYHFTLYDLPFENPEADDATWENHRLNIGAINRYAQKMNLAATAPRGDLTSTLFALVNPGSEYLIYQPLGGTFTVHLQNGSYDYEWFNPATVMVAGSGTISAAGGSQSFQPPFSGDAVLYLSSGSSREYPR